MTAFRILGIIFIATLLSSVSLNAAKGDLAPFNFMPDPGFETWTPANPGFNTDMPHTAALNQFGTYNVVSRLNEKNINYLSCNYGDSIFVADGLPFAQSDPTTRFLLMEYVIDVIPDRDYELSLKYMNPDVAWPNNNPILSVELDNIEILTPTSVDNPDTVCTPYIFNYSFSSGNRTQVTLSLYNNAIYRYPDSEGINNYSIQGNDIALWGFELYQYCEMEDNDLLSFDICEGDPIPLIEKILTEADRGATITWDFELGGSFSGPAIVDYIPTDNETVFIEIEDGIGCTEYDTFNINVFKFPPVMNIGSSLQAPRLCPCEIAQLEVPDNLPTGNFSYEWSTSDPDIILTGTSQSILDIDRPGEYILTITEENLLCTKELRYPVGDIQGNVDVQISDITENIGASTTLSISSQVSQDFVDCGFEEITGRLLYDYTVLHNSDLNYTIIDDATAEYEITIPNNASLDIPFTVLLGQSQTSEITLFDFQVECGDYDDYVNIGKGDVVVLGICDQPSQRLVDPEGQFQITNTHIAGNRLYTTMEILETTFHTVNVYDVTGAVIAQTSFNGRMNENKVLELDISSLSSQIMFMNISTPAESYTIMLAK